MKTPIKIACPICHETVWEGAVEADWLTKGVIPNLKRHREENHGRLRVFIHRLFSYFQRRRVLKAVRKSELK